jgi:NAD-dependent dihydropyrimidine dehydrogenase PreA subunit
MTHVITRLCTRAGDCVEVCPVDCIVPGPKGDGAWPYFYIDPETCIDCGSCVSVCPPESSRPSDRRNRGLRLSGMNRRVDWHSRHHVCPGQAVPHGPARDQR